MLPRMKAKWCFALPLLFVFAAPATMPPAVQRGMASISKHALAAHDRFLAGDLLEGRGPGTRGDDVPMEYIATQFASYGLKPAGGHGSYLQIVPLIGLTMDPVHTAGSFTRAGA